MGLGSFRTQVWKCTNAVGKRFDDLGVLQASAAFEAAFPWTTRQLPFDA
jgi:hypothetical protein